MDESVPTAGQILGHYRVIERIGAGGMGLVFRAADQQLERDVALKVLPPGMLTDEASRKRFRREALMLAKLNHPNIGTVYEFGTDAGLDYLVMEFVSGVGLETKVASGPMSQKQVLRLGVQLADGLASAHEHGVIHRDLKPANLRFTQDGRLKILDFGLAQFVRHETDLGVTSSLVQGTEVTGTLPYMPPEQLRGETTDERSDIWAAGAVLYEASTGRRPFPQTHSPLLIDAILNKQPDLPSAVSPGISPGLEMAILKCLDKDPELRYQSAKELKIDLERLTYPVSQAISAAIPVPVVPPPAPKPSPALTRSKTLIAAAVLVVLLLLGVIGYLQFRNRRPSETVTGPTGKRRSVAVLGFKNLTARPEAAWLATAIPEMLTTELAAGERLRTIPGEDIARMKQELSLPDSDALAAQTLTQVGKALDADLVVLGSYVALAGGKIRLDLRMQEVSTGETLASLPETGDEGNLFDLVSRAGAQLREKIGAGRLNPQDEAGVKASLPATPEAAKLYAEGLAKLRVSDAIAARDLLQQAVTADPTHALAHSAMAAAWSLLGYDEKARQSAKNAFDLSAPLSREDRLLIEARYRETSKEWDNAAGSYRTLFGFFPDNIEYGLLLARAQTRGGKGKDALTTIEALRRLPPPAGEDPRIDLAAADVWKSLGDFKQLQALAAQAADKARKQNEKLIVARALYLQGYAWENLNQPKDAISAADEARQIYNEVGDRNGQASTLEITGGVLSDHGDYPGALNKYQEELAIVRDVGNRRAESSALNNTALILSQQGDSEGARKMWEQALQIFREVGDKNSSAVTQINIAGVLKDAGDLAGAKKIYEQALGISREVNDRGNIALSMTGLGTVVDAQGDPQGAKKLYDVAVAIDLATGNANPSSDKLIDIGDALQHAGDLPGARKNYEDALSLSRAAGDKSMAAYALIGLGNGAVMAADFAQAHKNYDEALALRNELGEKDNVAVTRVAIAELAIEEGHPAEAEGPAHDAREELQQAHRNDDQIGATAVLVRALLAEGKTADAQRELAKLSPLMSKNQNLGAQLAFGIAKAQADAASGKTAAARGTFQELLAKATRAGLVPFQMEARLRLAGLDAKSGKSASVRSQVEQLQRDAKEKGFDLIARKAAAL